MINDTCAVSMYQALSPPLKGPGYEATVILAHVPRLNQDMQGMVTTICPALSSVMAILILLHYARTEKGRVQSYTSPFTTKNQGSRKAKSSDQASFKEKIKQSSAYFRLDHCHS